MSAENAPFTNSLGMKFLPVKDTDVMFCIHEVRYQDYAAFAAETPDADGDWKDQSADSFTPTGNIKQHPVKRASWEDAQKFCAWLSKREGKTYRLPTDREWSIAVGIGQQEDWQPNTTPATVFKVLDIFPWGPTWPPSKGSGNFGDQSRKAKAPIPSHTYIEDYDDGFPTTAPVMSFQPNQFGLYDLAGNVWEWCEDWFDATQKTRLMRGGGWRANGRSYLVSSYRLSRTPAFRGDEHGFRVVLGGSTVSVAAATQTKTAAKGDKQTQPMATADQDAAQPMSAIVTQLPTGPTTWTDTKGRITKATFKRMKGEAVHLETSDGSVHALPVGNLSPASQKLARDYHQQALAASSIIDPAKAANSGFAPPAALAAPSLPTAKLPTGPTTWIDTKGRSITATFKAVASGKVLLEIAGKVTPVALNTLSAQSQKLARDLAAAQVPSKQGIADKAFDAITRDDIVTAQDLLKNDQLDAADGRVLTVGTILIYKTCEGRFGKARVEAPAPLKSDVTLILSWNTFESNNTTRSSGKNFALKRLSAIDFDEGRLATLNDGADLHWGLQSEDKPYLSPVSRGALIAVLPSAAPVLASAAATTANAPPPSPVAPVSSAASSVDRVEGAKAGERKVFMLKPGVEMAFRWIPSGTFLMGSPQTEAFRPSTGESQFEVTLTDGFWMAETECTQAQWEAVIGVGNASFFKGASLPVTNLNWEQAAEFCKQLGEALKLPKPWRGRLPTEAQWEYACRAGTTSSLNDGTDVSGVSVCDNLDRLGWYLANSPTGTHEVARKRPNAWGLYDMYGNVREWCSSWFTPYPTRPQQNPRDERSGTIKVLRGGSFKYGPGGCRSASRNKGEPTEASEGIGFRPVLTNRDWGG